ncbi:23S rRNA (uracil(1939)-C(5))-methyltransferase RlmD [Thiocystis violascens]|uniref:23S rRNA (uracil(1939)-C(5))-methyltransferase RlmD n=1 Tax=Thiocystis violascens (strain ATCC 17096 / DSM 198 / 6111) TaxID=765911 RepID=I3YGL6_THIV6|nr:23S rRNA (uracil(1939)-C(5))-methyltransferase RlmD [Thiocystis violascens]AFL76134.1 23S rRNA (uracil-5-)-methyltransferase RumA [Thiocystis violascens DSM 198]
MSRKRKPLPQEPVEADIESLTHEGRGLAHIDGKAVFVDGALAGERVRFRYTRLQRRFDEGTVVEVLRAAPERVEPKCPHFGVCGGCSLQHMDTTAQIRMKQASLADVFARIGKVAPERWLDPLVAGHWGYRRKARLGVRHVLKKGRTLVGFRERGNAYLADLTRCEVLHPAVGERLRILAETVDSLSIRDQVPQIEVSMGDGPCVLVFRAMQTPSAADVEALLSLAGREGFHVYLQEGGVETIRPLPGQGIDLHYKLPRHEIRIEFQPNDFTQVNLELNRLMVDRALELLDVQPDDAVLDLFCGLGNFTLPLARQATSVVGVEGEAGLVARAESNAARNGIGNARFYTANLDGELDLQPWMRERFTRALLDPPRSGALQVLDCLPRLGVERILYVSCNPATLARDADRLVNGLGYKLRAAGVMDMFPHTAHVESMALFERET